MGYYGRNNLGDDLMLKNIVGILLEKNIRVNVMSFGSVDWLDESVNVCLWGDTKLQKIRNFNRTTKKSSIIIFGGGTCFTDEDGDGFFKFMSLSKLKKKRIAYIGVGIGNLKRKQSKLKTKHLINVSDYISFRDEKSYNIAKKFKKSSIESIEIVEDPANKLLEKYSLSNQNVESSGLVVAWRNLERYSDTTIGNDVNTISNFILAVCKDHCIHKIVIIDTDSYFDSTISKNIYETLKKNKKVDVVYSKKENFEEKLNILNCSNVIITSRLHVAVASKYINKPCYVYDYSPKIKYFVENEDTANIKLISNQKILEYV
ncbi:polysaccharide pyruvyl transferase family protein [Halobacillus sp. BAB-2008]|uniref:polysaccharide pyruvyl transferase family protein n=1 Tax=Halobacillus sp. BAB-2008 TaxID=1246484 RepID=UPI0002A51560|nr:polysaccharide pyruvyl transferase family protein [Halobacillus sp. BAB-2008]ELK44153.1 WffS protein [Halobacillus sp. BAB-2008]